MEIPEYIPSSTLCYESTSFINKDQQQPSCYTHHHNIDLDETKKSEKTKMTTSS